MDALEERVHRHPPEEGRPLRPCSIVHVAAHHALEADSLIDLSWLRNWKTKTASVSVVTILWTSDVVMMRSVPLTKAELVN
jgi:hypothetical protein